MKSIKYLNIAASVLMLAACAKEELVPSEELIPVSESTTVTFVATDGTKTVLGGDLKTTSWDKKENVLLWEGETETPLTIGEDNKSYEGGILTITADVTSPESTFYSVIGPEGEDNVTRTSAAVLATQNPSQASFDPNAEILVAQPATCGEGNTVALRYNRPVAITVATLKNLEEGEKVLSVKITADKKLTGNVNFKYEGTNVIAEMAGTGDAITCNYTTNNTVVQGNEGEGYIFPVYFISLKAEVMIFEFEVCTDKHKYYRKITRPEDSPIVLNDNRVATFGFKLENADKADAEGDKFVKVTEEPDDWSGEYLLVYESGDNKALCWTGVDETSCYVETDVANGEIAAKPDGAVTLTIASIDNGYSIKVNGGDNNGKYIGQNSYANSINISESSQVNTIEIAESSAKISGTGSSGDSHVALRYNKASDQKRFRYYKSGQEAVQLYKKAAGGYGKYTLATPANIQYSAETQKITWDAVENAGKYTISLNGGESVECPSNEYDASTLAAEYYYATVVAYPSAEKESTYQASSAGTNEGWFKIGEPTMKKIEAKDIDVLAGARSLEITWPEQTLATNGYSSELWSVGEDREKLQEKTEIAPDATSITYDKLEPNTKYRVYLTVKGVTLNDDRGERVYGECKTYKDPSTAQLFTIAEITKAGSYAIENAVVVAKANDGFLVKDNIDENAGYIMVNKAADDLIVGDIVSVSGTVVSFNSQLRFGELSNYSKTGHNDSFVQPATADKYTGVFEYLKYVNIIGNMTSSSGWLVTDATGNKLKVFANDKTDANKYVSVTGYLTHDTGTYKYLIATEIVEHTLTATPEELTWEANATGAKSVTIEAKDGETVAEWTYSPMSADGWQISTNDSGLQIAPTANTSIDKKELTIKVTHKTNTQLTKEIKLSQDGKEVSYAKVMNVSELSGGDVIVLAYESGNKAAGPMGSNVYFSSVDATINNGVLTSPNAIPITLGKEGENWTLSISGSKVGATAAKSLSTTGGTTTWTISISNGNASITSTTSTYGTIKYNTAAPRFLNYASGQTAIQIYKIDNTTSRNLQFSANADTKDIKDGKNVSALALTGNTDGGITYSSTNTAVATIDSNSGAITLVSAGTTTIKATAPKTATLKADEASYTLTVTDTRVKEKLSLPTGLSSGTPTSNGTTLTWTSVTNAGSYKVEYKESGESNWTSTVVAIASCELTGLKASTTYSWQVTAIPSDTETYANSDPAQGTDFKTAENTKTEKTFEITSDDVVSNSGYAKYESTIDERNWIITFGGNNKSVGTNSGNRSKCNLSSYTKYAVSPVTTSDVASAFASTTKLTGVKKISYTFNGGSNQTNTNVYVIYSSDGNTFSQITLTSGTQGATISSGTAYEFNACDGYFALLFKATNSSGNWRIDYVNIEFTYED